MHVYRKITRSIDVGTRATSPLLFRTKVKNRFAAYGGAPFYKHMTHPSLEMLKKIYKNCKERKFVLFSLQLDP